MAKKIEEPDVKKECPSCGLGVSLDSKMCEFCGWDFEEEDEWILQIEKLERELMLEKRKFEPGSVEQKIQATLYTPTPSRPPVQKAEAEPEHAPERPVAVRPVAPKQVQKPAPEPPVQKQRAVAPPRPKPAPVEETVEIDDLRIRTVRGGPEAEAQEGRVRRVKPAKPATPAESSSEGAGEGKTRKVRVVRKVKK